MNFEPTDDQRAFLAAVDKMVERHQATPAVPERFQYAQALERELDDAGFFDCMTIDELGSVSAAALVMALSRLPLCAELVASALIAPWLIEGLPRPYAVLWDSDAGPARFLPVARTVIRVRGNAVDVAAIGPADVQTVESLFAYPMGVLGAADALAWKPLPGADVSRLRRAWQVGTAAETAGCLGAALDSVLDHVKERRQFGRPLGSLQAVQHRLAECATLVEGAKWLALKAADTGTPLDAATAAGFAQGIAKKVAYDLHQFMGAMGLTLEHPLHRWTYRTKLLSSDLGGTDRHMITVAEAAWPAPTLNATQESTQ